MPPRFISGKPKPIPVYRSLANQYKPSPSSQPVVAPSNLIGVGGDDRITEYSSEGDICPVCKNDRFLTPGLRLKVSNLCYHTMCESCIERIFKFGPEKCPQCSIILRLAQFKPIIFQDLSVQKELAIRKRTSKIFNKRLEDFTDLKAYNDYLEEFEILTFNLITSTDVEDTEEKIRKYEMDNRAAIEANLSLTELEAEEIKLRDEEARKVAVDTSEEYQRMDEEDRLAKAKEKEAVLAGLESSTATASSIISAARRSQLKRSTARTTLDSAVPLTVERIAALRLLHASSNSRDNNSPVSQLSSSDDIARELERYDSYNALFEIRRKALGYKGEKDLGDDTAGFEIEEVWEKAVRTGLMGLFLEPLKGKKEEFEMDT